MTARSVLHWFVAIFICVGVNACADSFPGVLFPGPEPGAAQSEKDAGRYTLRNNLLAATWAVEDQSLAPQNLENRLTGQSYQQSASELFRISTVEDDAAARTGIAVEISLTEDAVVLRVSGDGCAWHKLAMLDREEYPGSPKLVRIGKMNPLCQAKDHSTSGPLGKGSISDLKPVPDSIPSGRFDFEAPPHAAIVKEYEFPQGADRISARIDKGSGQGMTWGPAIALIWEDGEKFIGLGVRDDKGNDSAVFNLLTPEGERIVNAALPDMPDFDLLASDMRLVAGPRIVDLKADPDAVRIIDRLPGRAIECIFAGPQGMRVLWRAELRDACGFIRQTIKLRSPEREIDLKAIELGDIRLPGLKTVGNVAGSPAAGSGFYAGIEMPGYWNAVVDDGVRMGFACELQLSPRQRYDFCSVIGVAPRGQLRRAFLHYIECARARPSKPFLHYNCWYDLAFGMNADNLMDVVEQFSAELVRKRGADVQSYLIDDGWDNPSEGLWSVDKKKFPQGFEGLKKDMEPYDANLSIWISPLGGYGGAKERTQWARKMGLIPQDASLDLAYPAYKQWFQDKCLELMREGGVDAFKWDKAGSGVSPHFMALLDIARNLRQEDPDLFINVTVGTWPSPFWLNHVDCTWRNGTADIGWMGKSSDPDNPQYNRERWLTFRDDSAYDCFVVKAPLYPLNSVMHHGIAHGRHFQGGSIGQNNPPDLKNEARSYFASGASLQELYLTPSMLDDDAWDAVADAANWARANADVLRDAHWVGGNPQELEVYGYAAWSPDKATLMLRNPDDRPQKIALDARQVFNPPAGAAQRYELKSPYADQRLQRITLASESKVEIELRPFEVLVFDAGA